jgi:hypothetical protein
MDKCESGIYVVPKLWLKPRSKSLDLGFFLQSATASFSRCFLFVKASITIIDNLLEKVYLS